MITITPIGFVHNTCSDSQTPELIKKETSRIEILPPYTEGLRDIEQCEYIDLLFSFHQEERTELTTHIRTGETKGIFATRSPQRPNHIGVTTVKLLQREGNTLYVTGADALNGSPVFDIKHCDTSVFNQTAIHHSILKKSPRIDIIRNIMEHNTTELLLHTAQFHGHICPGLALGIMAATRVMHTLYAEQRDPDDFTLTVNMKNCPIDGILYVTGITPATNRLTLKYSNDMYFELKDKKENGWKVKLLESNRDYINREIPTHLSAIEKGFAVLQLDFNRLFKITPQFNSPG